MKASVIIEKSFDEGKRFNKEYAPGDFLEFFEEEGKYLDRLADTMKIHAKEGEKFVMTYTVTLTK